MIYREIGRIGIELSLLGLYGFIRGAMGKLLLEVGGRPIAVPCKNTTVMEA